MNRSMNSTITQLILKAFDKAGVTDAEWRSSLKVSPSRLERLRAGRATLTDADLERVTQVTGEPWESLILGVVGGSSPITVQTRALIGELHVLKRTADAEASEHHRRAKRSAADKGLSARFRPLAGKPAQVLPG